jgi:starvation-inducible DNA-binding protein
MQGLLPESAGLACGGRLARARRAISQSDIVWKNVVFGVQRRLREKTTTMTATKTAVATFPTRIDLPENDRRALIELINGRLADTADLYSQVKQAHWNVKGATFFQLHQLFDLLAAEVFPFIDLIAERATALGGVALGTARMAASASTLTEYPVKATEGQEHLKALIDRYALFTANIRKAIDIADEHHDKATADMFTEISRTADKQLWFLEAHVQH